MPALVPKTVIIIGKMGQHSQRRAHFQCSGEEFCVSPFMVVSLLRLGLGKMIDPYFFLYYTEVNMFSLGATQVTGGAYADNILWCLSIISFHVYQYVCVLTSLVLGAAGCLGPEG